MKRLIKKSEFLDYLNNPKTDSDNMYSIFKSLITSKEIKEIKKTDPNSGVRGVILDNNEVYAWPSEILHEDINKYTSSTIDIDQFRFSYEEARWIIDAHQKYTFDEITDLIIKYESILTQFGDVKNVKFDIYQYNGPSNKYDFLLLDEMKAYKKDADAFKIQKIMFFKNPTTQEMNNVKQNNDVNGVILDNGDMYIWPSSIPHIRINDYIEPMQIDVNQFSFWYSDGTFLIYAHDKYTFDEIINLIIQYESKLTQIYNTNNAEFMIDNYHGSGINQILNINDIKQYQQNPQYFENQEQTAFLNIKRLVKKAVFVTGFNKNQEYYEVYKNPINNQEINEVISQSDYAAVRGVILDNGDIYIWPGNTLHMHINKYLKDIQINIDQFRFAYEKEFGWWLIDAHKSYTWDNITDLTIKYENILSQIGDINAAFNIFSYIDDNNNYPEELTLDEIKQYKIENNSNKQQEYIVK